MSLRVVFLSKIMAPGCEIVSSHLFFQRIINKKMLLTLRNIKKKKICRMRSNSKYALIISAKVGFSLTCGEIALILKEEAFVKAKK